MLSLEKYISSLLPSFEKKRIVSNLERINEEYEKTVIPVYRSTHEAFKTVTFDTLANAEFTKAAKRLLPSYKNTIHGSIYRVLVKVPAKLKVLKELVDEHYDTHVTSEGMTYAKVNVLQMVEVMDFSAMYARRLLLAMYNMENTPFEEKLKERVFFREVMWLRRGQEAFFKCLEIMDMRESEFKSKFTNIKDLLVVPGNVDETIEVVGHSKLDPMKTSLIPYNWSPLYHIGIAVATYQHACFERAREEADGIELHLLALKHAKEGATGKEVIKIKKQIEYNENRIIKVRKRIKDMIEDVEKD